MTWNLPRPRPTSRELLPPNTPPKQPKRLLRRQRRQPSPRKRTSRRISSKSSLLLILLIRQLRKLKRRRPLLRLRPKSGRSSPRNRRRSQRPKSRPLRLPPKLARRNLMLKGQELRPSTMPLSSNKPRLTDLPLWPPSRLMKPLRRLEEREKRNRLLSTREEWLQEELPSRRPSDTFGQPDRLVFPCSRCLCQTTYQS